MKANPILTTTKEIKSTKEIESTKSTKKHMKSTTTTTNRMKNTAKEEDMKLKQNATFFKNSLLDDFGKDLDELFRPNRFLNIYVSPLFKPMSKYPILDGTAQRPRTSKIMHKLTRTLHNRIPPRPRFQDHVNKVSFGRWVSTQGRQYG